MRRGGTCLAILVALALLTPQVARGCSCGGIAGLLETGPHAVHIVEARVLSHHPAPQGTLAESIVVQVVHPLRGSLSGEVRLYGSGQGDCTVSVSRYEVGGTFLFLLGESYDLALPEKPGYALYGVCAAVSAKVLGRKIEGVFESTKRGQASRIRTMSLREYLRAVGGAEQPKGDHR